jgi:glutamyl-Q tRNA(Asp) synthetase
VVVNAVGEKLSKQTRAAAIDHAEGSKVLAAAMHFLGHAVPDELRGAPPPDLWRWAFAQWRIERVPSVRAVYPGRPSGDAPI